MATATIPQDEQDRLAALIALNILDTERAANFDIFPGLASHLCSVPIAALSLVDKDRQWFKASVGLDVTETSRDVSFCAHAILEPDQVLYVPDATKDHRFAENALVVGDFGLRFYAGAPIIGPSGHAVGAICVIDREPRQMSEAVLTQLRQLAVGVGSALKLHATVQALQKLSETDSLTGLANRAAFDQRLRAALLRPDGGRVGLLLLDLDGFKSINDLFGHNVGDAALQEVSLRLGRVARAQDTVCRFGGDEFCFVVEDFGDATELQDLADDVHSALARPFLVEQQIVQLRTSIGIAVCPDDASQPETLIRKADTALYEAKRSGPGVTRRAAADEIRHAPSSVGRNEMQEMLRSALIPPGHEPFSLALQPIFLTQTRQLTGFEALVRWADPEGRVMPPAEFVPMAESTGLVVLLDRWVLDQACALAATWPDHLTISSNFSAANFFAGDLVQDVSATLARRNLPAHRLKMEITESVLLRDPCRVQRIVRQLRELGVHIILDDFGAGYASLAYLRDYAFSGLKIDRSFIATMETDPRSRAFVQAITEMAGALGIDTTAEGVATQRQLRLLRKMGIRTVQGFLLGHPMAPDTAATVTQENKSRSRRGQSALESARLVGASANHRLGHSDRMSVYTAELTESE